MHIWCNKIALLSLAGQTLLSPFLHDTVIKLHLVWYQPSSDSCVRGQALHTICLEEFAELSPNVLTTTGLAMTMSHSLIVSGWRRMPSERTGRCSPSLKKNW